MKSVFLFPTVEELPKCCTDPWMVQTGACLLSHFRYKKKSYLSVKTCSVNAETFLQVRFYTSKDWGQPLPGSATSLRRGFSDGGTGDLTSDPCGWSWQTAAALRVSDRQINHILSARICTAGNKVLAVNELTGRTEVGNLRSHLSSR